MTDFDDFADVDKFDDVVDLDDFYDFTDFGNLAHLDDFDYFIDFDNFTVVVQQTSTLADQINYAALLPLLCRSSILRCHFNVDTC